MKKLVQELAKIKLKLVAPLLFLVVIGTFLLLVLNAFGYTTDVTLLGILVTGIISIMTYLVTNKDNTHDTTHDTSSVDITAPHIPTDINVNIKTDE